MDILYLSEIFVELILVSKALVNHSEICASVKEHTLCVSTETEGLDETDIFICRLGGGYSELLAGDF